VVCVGHAERAFPLTHLIHNTGAPLRSSYRRSAIVCNTAYKRLDWDLLRVILALLPRCAWLKKKRLNYVRYDGDFYGIERTNEPDVTCFQPRRGVPVRGLL